MAIESKKCKKPIEYEEFLLLPNLIYKFIGYDFIKTISAERATKKVAAKKSKYLNKCYIVIALLCYCYCRFYMHKQLHLFVQSGDIKNVVRLGTYIIFSIDSNIKFLAFAINYKRVRHIYLTLKEAYPATKSERQHYALKRHLLSPKVRLTIIIYFLICWFIIMSPVLQSLLCFLYDTLTSENAEASAAVFAYLRPVPMQYNFRIESPLLYIVIYIVEALTCNIGISTNMGTDMWLICFTMQMCMHLEYIARMLKLYKPQLEHAAEDCAFLKQLIKKHQLILGLNVQLNEIFGISLVFNLMSTTGLLCVVAVQLTIEGLGMEFMKYAIFLSTIIAQFYLVCYYGQKLINVSENIAIAAYNNEWYNGSRAYKKLLSILILRTQKQAELSAKGFHAISLDTFKIVMGMTYRVFALLQTMLK